jgi:four helix bundle protein
LVMASTATRLAKEIPRGHRSIADHLLRASSNTVLLLAEGANRRGAKEKRQRFVEARGECAEAAAASDLVKVLELAPETEADALKQLASRVFGNANQTHPESIIRPMRQVCSFLGTVKRGRARSRARFSRIVKRGRARSRARFLFAGRQAKRARSMCGSSF